MVLSSLLTGPTPFLLGVPSAKFEVVASAHHGLVADLPRVLSGLLSLLSLCQGAVLPEPELLTMVQGFCTP